MENRTAKVVCIDLVQSSFMTFCLHFQLQLMGQKHCSKMGDDSAHKSNITTKKRSNELRFCGRCKGKVTCFI